MSSLVRSVIKIELLLDCDDQANNTTRQINFLGMQYLSILLKLDNISWRKTLRILHTFMQWHVVQTLFQEMKSHHNPKRMDPLETPKLGRYRKLQHVICMVQNELRTELSLWAESILTRGLEFLMDQIEFVMDFNNNYTEILEHQLGAHALQLEAKDFVNRSKAKNNPQRREHSRTEFG